MGDTGITGLHSDTSATCGPSEKAAGFEGQEFNGPPRNSSDPREESQSESEYDPDDYVGTGLGNACVQCNEGGADVDWYQHDWPPIEVEKFVAKKGHLPLMAICMQCSNTEKGRSFIQLCKDEFGYVTK